MTKVKTCFSFRKEGQQLIASYTPDSEVENVSVKDITHMIAGSGYGGMFLHADAIVQLEAMQETVTGVVEVAVAERRDGELTVELSHNDMEARISMSPPQGGHPVRLEVLEKGLADKGIVYGIQHEAIEQAIEAGVADAVLVAEGLLPQQGEDGHFVTLYHEHAEDHPKLDASGRADMRELAHFPVVKKGAPLMRYCPPTPGITGHNVLGLELPAKPGRGKSFSAKRQGVEVDPFNQNLLVAAMGGQPQKIERGVIVKPVLQVSSVDITTGNIDFEGTVTVNGDVVSGTTIVATEDILVSGTVEGASLIAGKDITVGQGIIGQHSIRDEDDSLSEHAARIICGGSLHARFIEKAYIEVKHDVRVDSLIMHAELQAGHQLIVGDEHSVKGHVVGGIVRAGKLIQARVLGSRGEVHTLLEVGIGTVSHEVTVKAHVQLLETMADRKKLLHLIRHHETQRGPESQTLLSHARERLFLVDEAIKDQSRRYREVQASEQCIPDARIVVQSAVYPGVELLLCRTPHVIREALAAGRFVLKNNAVEFIAA